MVASNIEIGNINTNTTDASNFLNCMLVYVIIRNHTMVLQLQLKKVLLILVLMQCEEQLFWPGMLDIEIGINPPINDVNIYVNAQHKDLHEPTPILMSMPIQSLIYDRCDHQ